MPKKPKPHELRKHAFRVRTGLERSGAPRKMLPERHLFVTEGTKTEPNYLQGIIDLICKRYGNSAVKQFQVIGEGDNTLNLLQKAENYQQNEADEFQHVWILFDQDDFPADSFDNTENRCHALNERLRAQGRDTVFHAIWSNQCFELWLLLHYEYLQTDITRKQYRANLSKHIGRHYQKNDDALFDQLLPYMDAAIKRAKKLMENYSSDMPPSQQAPATKVYELVEYLRRYM